MPHKQVAALTSTSFVRANRVIASSTPAPIRDELLDLGRTRPGRSRARVDRCQRRGQDGHGGELVVKAWSPDRSLRAGARHSARSAARAAGLSSTLVTAIVTGSAPLSPIPGYPRSPRSRRTARRIRRGHRSDRGVAVVRCHARRSHGSGSSCVHLEEVATVDGRRCPTSHARRTGSVVRPRPSCSSCPRSGRNASRVAAIASGCSAISWAMIVCTLRSKWWSFSIAFTPMQSARLYGRRGLARSVRHSSRWHSATGARGTEQGVDSPRLSERVFAAKELFASPLTALPNSSSFQLIGICLWNGDDPRCPALKCHRQRRLGHSARV